MARLELALTLALSRNAGEGIGIRAVTPICDQALALCCLEPEQRSRVGEQEFVLHSRFEIDFIETRQRFFEIDVGKIGAEQRFVLEPAANGFEKNFRQLLGEIAGGVDEQIFLVRDDADQLLFPRPAWVCGDDFHFGEISRKRVEMNRPAVVEGDAAAAVGIRSQYGEADVEQCRFAARLDHFPNVVKALVVGIETLIGRMELEAFDSGILHQLFSVTGNGG